MDTPPSSAIDDAKLRKLRPRLRFWILASLLFVTVVAGSIVAYFELMRMRMEPIRIQHSETIQSALSLLQGELGDTLHLAQLLRKTVAVSESLLADPTIDKALLERQFTIFAEVVPSVAQVRWIDEQGWEVVRIDADHQRNVIVRKEGDLQNKRSRYYFSETMKLNSDEIYVSPIDLNVENGEIERPFKPMLRLGLRGGSNVLHDGALVINFDLTDVFNRLREIGKKGPDVQLLNNRGFWLLHSDPRQEWGWMLDRKEVTLASLNPVLWARLQSGSNLASEVIDGALVSSTDVTLAASRENRLQGRHLQLIALTGSPELEALRQEVVTEILPPALLALLAGLALIGHIVGADHQRERLTESLSQERSTLARSNEELKIALERLQLVQDELVETRKLSSLGLMVAGVAHELNTPTGGAMMCVSVLQGAQQNLEKVAYEGMSREQLDGYFARSREGLSMAMKHLERTTSMIRSFKRLAIDRADETQASFSLLERVEDLVLSLRPQTKRTKVRLETSIASDIEMTSYPGIISQILQNLVDNALVHGIGAQRDGVIRISASLSDDQLVTLEVADNGRGIDPKLKDRIFDPFITSGRGKGHTGLGLHLVHQWVHQLLGGTITVKSASNGGTIFTVTLPRSAAEVRWDQPGE
ncbi:MAG: hypothetical protein H6953_00380 [Chromatiaceae bacterium]|nr:hypothetical protein [Chromatiaceae bacterium]MCP5313599.1 hypothetical protein [Chromatiaceae bacterium]